MDYVEALGWIEEAEGGKDAAAAIRAHVGNINKETQSWRQKYKGINTENSNNAEIIKTLTSETEDLKSKAKALEDQLASTSAELSAQKDIIEKTKNPESPDNKKIADTEAQLASTNQKIADLEKALADSKTAFAEIELAKNKLQEEALFGQISTIAGANPTVLRKLVTPELKMEIANDQVIVVSGEEKIPLRDYADANWKEFVPALFVVSSQQSTTTASTPRLPSGSPKGASTEDKSIVTKILGGVYSAPKKK